MLEDFVVNTARTVREEQVNPAEGQHKRIVNGEEVGNRQSQTGVGKLDKVGDGGVCNSH